MDWLIEILKTGTPYFGTFALLLLSDAIYAMVSVFSEKTAEDIASDFVFHTKVTLRMAIFMWIATNLIK